jgi:hypothetical protein
MSSNPKYDQIGQIGPGYLFWKSLGIGVLKSHIIASGLVSTLGMDVPIYFFIFFPQHFSFDTYNINVPIISPRGLIGVLITLTNLLSDTILPPTVDPCSFVHI